MLKSEFNAVLKASFSAIKKFSRRNLFDYFEHYRDLRKSITTMGTHRYMGLTSREYVILNLQVSTLNVAMEVYGMIQGD